MLTKNRLFTIIIIIFSVMMVVLLVLYAVAQIGKTDLQPKPTPTPTPPEETIFPSVYATDSAILKIEEEAKSLEKELIEVDLYESELNPPVLDMNVKF